MKQGNVQWLFAWLSVFLVSGCNASAPSAIENLSNMEIERIIGKFSYHEPSTVEVTAPVPKAPEGPSQWRLLHTDPLDLRENELTIIGSGSLAWASKSMIGRFYDDGFRGVISMNHSPEGDGFKAMCSDKKMDLITASRLMRADEKALCEKNGIELVKINIGFDPIVMVTNNNNQWLDSVSLDQLRELFKSARWSDLDSSFPNDPMVFFLPAKDSGEMDVVSEQLYGSSEASSVRSARKARFYPYILEMIRDIENNANGIGFARNSELVKLKQVKARVLPIHSMLPDISGGTYPLKLPVYLFTTTSALKKNELQTFLAHYLNHSHAVMPTQGFSIWEGAAAREEQRVFLEALEQSGSHLGFVSLLPE